MGMGFMGNNFGRFARDVTRMEIAASETKLREINPEQAREDHAGRIAAHLAMLVVAGVLLFLLARGLFFGNATEQEKKDFFYQFTAEQMVLNKASYFLYEELSDPALLIQTGVWKAYAGEMDDAQLAVTSWRGEGCLVQDWTDLVLAESARLWEEWYYGTEDITADEFILREIGAQMEAQTLPALGENTWLVTDREGVQHILARPGEKGWYLQPLEDFRK